MVGRSLYTQLWLRFKSENSLTPRDKLVMISSGQPPGSANHRTNEPEST